MCSYTDDIIKFLEGKGFRISLLMQNGCNIIRTQSFSSRQERFILPLEISSETIGEATLKSRMAFDCIESMKNNGHYPLVITQDRWSLSKEMMKLRLLAHLEVFSQLYARNCEVRRIDKITASSFLEKTHSYGYAAGKYHYGLFLKRITGHLKAEISSGQSELIGRLVAVATFSNARKWLKGDREIRSYEWTRYASLPEFRINGGMGKILQAFIEEVEPDDIMSYADLEWSEGGAYEKLGFVNESLKEPVDFIIDADTWQRTALKKSMSTDICDNSVLQSGRKYYFRNFGSFKFRLKLTDYM